eukprot:s1024_g4.t1
MNGADLRARLFEAHGETAPRSWTKTQLRLRLVELEGVEIMERKKKEISPLRALEIEINKHSARKSELQSYVTKELGLVITYNETIEVLKVKALNHAYMNTAGHHTDHVGFGQHAHLTYAEIYQQEKAYLEWAAKQMAEGSVSPRLRRLMEWVQRQGDQVPKSGTIKPKKVMTECTPQSVSSSSNMEALVVSLAQSVQNVVAEVKELKESSQGRRKKGQPGESTSSEWEKMTDVEQA